MENIRQVWNVTESGNTAVFLVSSGGQCGAEQNMKISTLSTLSDPKYLPLLETAVVTDSMKYVKLI